MSTWKKCVEETNLSKIEYDMKAVNEKREKTSRSIFDPIIDEFIKSEDDLVELTVTGRSASYMKNNILKRLVRREIANVEVTLGYGVVYLEKTDPT